METPEIIINNDIIEINKSDEILECKKNSTLTIKGRLIKKKVISVTFFTNTNMISVSINDDKEAYRNIILSITVSIYRDEYLSNI